MIAYSKLSAMFSRISAVMLKTTYGISVVSHEDPVRDLPKIIKYSTKYQLVPQFLQVGERLIKALRAGMFGRHLVDFFPILQHLPSWTPFKREAKVVFCQ